MTERFTIEIDDDNFAQILDNNVPIGQYNLCNVLNRLYEENEDLKYQIGCIGKNNKTCKNCTSYLEDIKYCTMYDMDEIEPTSIVVACEYGEWSE